MTHRQLLVHSGSASAQLGPRVNITCLFSRDGAQRAEVPLLAGVARFSHRWRFAPGKAWTDPVVVLPEHDASGRSQIGGYSAVQPLLVSPAEKSHLLEGG